MNQEKIGKFIAECRKKKNLTQADLADKLGVSDRSVGNWENGRNMPDLSLFKPLCDELGITINELIGGENIKKENYQEKFEENIINTIDYSTTKIREKTHKIGIILIATGILISMIAMGMFPTDSSWGAIYSIFGGIISLIGVGVFTKKYSPLKRVIFNFGYFILYVAILFMIDYCGVIEFSRVPRFCYLKEYGGNMIIYKTGLYNVYRINHDTKNEYYIIDTKNEYTEETVPVVPFNREKSGIDTIIKYKNKYVGNNSNDGNLINHLPLSEYGYVFQIHPNTLGLTVNYSITDWYIDENYYVEKSLIYNSVSMFALIDNLEHITFNFSGKTYNVSRKDIEHKYPNYNLIIKDGINKENFNKYLESKINDDDFINKVFDEIFNS